MNKLNLNQQFSAAEYLMIDVANGYGLDKETFDVRIQWVKDNLDNLEDFIPKADDPVMYCKAVMTIRAVQLGKATGHMVALDSTTSGVQILSALTGCKNGMLLTNLVDPKVRIDCYTAIYNSMLEKLDEIECEITRKEAKEALMTMIYGSSAKPKEIFGEDTEELKAFLTTVQEDLPGAYEYLQEAKDLWQPNALEHSWTLPDGHVASVKVMQKKSFGVEVDELNHHTFAFETYVNEGSDKGITLVANTTHSIDGYIVREVVRRCNYDAKQVNYYLRVLREELEARGNVNYIYNTNNALSLAILDGVFDIEEMSTNDVNRYIELLEGILELPSFEAVCIHDAYLCSPVYSNYLRFHYKEVLAELAESEILSHIFSEIAGEEIVYENVENGYTKSQAAALIRNSAYAIC